MATQSSPSFSRFMGFGLKSYSASPGSRKYNSNADADWYIPYNGPYEQPRATPTKDKELNRDSWGDPVFEGLGENDEEQHILDDVELHNRYGGHAPTINERKGRARARTHSSVSGRTVSSGTVDPGRVSTATARRSTISHTGKPPPVPSYINPDSTGGVGESPVPRPHNVRDTTSTRRKSLISLFTFNSSSKKAPTSPKVDRRHTPSTPGLSVQERSSKLVEIPRLPSDPVAAAELLRDSVVTGDEDYYNSYYASLIQHPHHHQPPKTDLHLQQSSSTHSQPSAVESEPSPAIHPYAYTFSAMPPPMTDTPLSAPPPKTHFDQSRTLRIYSDKSRVVSSPQTKSNSMNIHSTLRSTHSLKNSTSTPDLRHATPRTKPPLPKGKERWLSAETWCDALLFPKPRFKVKQKKIAGSGGSGRLVSPPGSPVLGYFANGNAPQPGIASRVLAHSRSMMDLSAPPAAGPSGAPDHFLRVPEVPENSASSRPPRPKSWALDDLALPSPVPSLARVLEDGQILEHQRKKWQTQAVNSFQNSRARSLSRTRAKSLTNKQSKGKDNSRMEFLAARGLLGDQNVIPVTVVKPRQIVDSQTESRGTTVGQTSSRHHHTSSSSKTMSKSSRAQSHSRNHSRSESLGKSAAKIVKHTAAALCAFDDEGLSPAEERTGNIEGALQGNSTKVIRLADPAQLYIESPLSSRNGHSVSPTPSGISDSRMGIAVTTPHIMEETLESIRMPAHPYAQGGLSYYTPPSDLQSNARNGYHASSFEQQALANNQSLTPPPWHPYAKAASHDSYQSEVKVVPRQRSDSNVPPPQKMWAQWSSGVVQEILPNEIQYSPHLPPTDDSQVRRQVRNSSPIYDTVGVGETLASAAMQPYNRDSGIGTSEGHTPARVEYDAESSRKPVQYDVTRPLYLQKAAPMSPLHAAISSTIPLRPVTHRHDSSGNQSSDSSPPVSPPPPLGNVDDLGHFHDLFYRPNKAPNASMTDDLASPEIPWDVNSSGQRGSGLTSIARQLNEDLSNPSGTSKHSISIRSQSSLSALRQSLYDARTPPADANLRFVFSDIPSTVLLNANGERKPVQANILTFKPSIQIPEDVESSRASSPARSPVDNSDELDEFRLGQIESAKTPPAISGENRVSFAAQMAFAMGEDADRHNDDEENGSQLVSVHPTHSSLLPPSSGFTRSSYVTTSDGSRMSGLSDFPDPPPQRMTPAHMSLLSSYFDETITEKEIADVRAYGHVKPATRSRSGSILTSRTEGQASARPQGDVPHSLREGKSSLDSEGNEEIDNLIASLSP